MATELYTNIPNNKLGDILASIRNGKIGLPDLQRPFVWQNSKVRDLLDSMMKGYPIGYIMIWDSPDDFEDKKSVIGKNSKSYTAPKELIIDGQQRLTALVSALYGIKIKDKNFKERQIKIAYNPFAKTLVSVYEPETHEKIDEFCAQSRIPADKTSYNHLVEVDPTHLVRMAVGIGFRRARLEYAYKLLRGKDLKTGKTNPEIRECSLCRDVLKRIIVAAILCDI